MIDRANDGAAIPDLHENNEIMCISRVKVQRNK